MHSLNQERLNKIERQRERNSNRPRGLKGRDIGMYYRNLSKQKKENEEPNKIRLGPDVSIPKQILENVKLHLKNSETTNDENIVSTDFTNYYEYTVKVNFEQLLEESHKAQNETTTTNEIVENTESTGIDAPVDVPQLTQERSKLPVFAKCQEIVTAIKENQVLLIAGSTGCGKTTQVPQFLLDEFAQKESYPKYGIVCTQPRRISAITIAERVAEERGERLGNSVGFQIRLEHKLPKQKCSILYCTTGILLQKMQKDPLLSFAKAIFLDEVHERSVETDLLMGLIKKILPYRKDLRIILMSATVCERDFCEYFDNCKTFYIEGTLFPVTELYIEDILQETGYNNFQKKPTFRKAYGKKQHVEEDQYFAYKNMITPYIRELRGKYSSNVLDSLAHFADTEGCDNLQFLEFLVYYISKNKPPGAILVFLPSYDKISKLHGLLKKPQHPIARGLEGKIAVYALHSRMLSSSQKSVFLSPPNGVRKVILATNIAETSITINDVVYVVNPGRAKVSHYNVQANIQTLEEVWITKANTQQRKGRAGRVQAGICYNLFTRAREMTMSEVPVPEILCTKLESIILNLKLLHINDVTAFMGMLLNPPQHEALKTGTNLLKRIGALDREEYITPLGIHLARLPIDPQIGKMVLMSALFRCFDPITTIAAALSFKSPFFAPVGKEKMVDRVKLELSESSRSDHLLNHYVIQKYRDSIDTGNKQEFCFKNFLSWSTLDQLENMKQQFAGNLKSVSFLESAECAEIASNKNSENITLVRAIIAAGLYPNMAFLRKARQIRNRVFTIHSMSTPEERKVNFHSSSVNFGVSSFDSHYFVYFEKQKSNGVKIMDATMIFPMALLIFGDCVEVGVTKDSEPYISVGNAYFFKCETETSDVVLALRKRLEWLMLKKAKDPSPIDEKSNEEEIVKAIQILLSYDAFDEEWVRHASNAHDDEDDYDDDNDNGE